jgi:SAM-dependent methyltransferase
MKRLHITSYKMLQTSEQIRKVVRSLPGIKLLRAGRDKLFGVQDVHWARVVMNRTTRGLVESLQPEKLSVLEISGNAWGRLGIFKEYKAVAYPDYDVSVSTLPQTFDLIIAEQVFEHLLWPYRAGRNVYQMINPGGYFLVTTPFLLRIHNHPFDCTRWTETGIKHLLAECGFPLEKIHTGSWGNRACIRANFRRWVPYKSRLHSLHNEPEFPVVVWALAQK